MNDVQILIIDNKDEICSNLKNKLKEKFKKIYSCCDEDKITSFIEKKKINIIVIGILGSTEDSFSILKRIKRYFYEKPVQLVLILNKNNKLKINKAIDLGVDDFISDVALDDEILTRVEAAVIRYKNQLSLFKEREFYRKAVVQEEELSSKILDQNLFLKKAFLDIEVMNKDLEKSKQELEKIARCDMLSQLYNRMALFNIIDVEVERSLRTERPLSGVMLDIDNFKKINDNFGHQCGDHVIKEVGLRLKTALRKYDSAGRYGGEEFFIVLPETDLQQAVAISERFRKSLNKTPIQFHDKIFSVTASLGVAELKEAEKSDSWIARADSAMYKAKDNGKNKVYVS